MILRCKCCNSATSLLGTLDFNKTCEDRRAGRVFPISSELVPYYACRACGFIFTDYCDSWSADDFKTRIYNDRYSLADCDPADRVEDSASYKNGRRLAALFEDSQKQIKVLDFGAGGNPGRCGKAFIDAGFNVTSYEPFFADDATALDGPYDLIYAIEVIEHCHNVLETAQLIAENLSANGILYLSTLLHPFPTPENILGSWYIAPRNGHISIFTFPAIAVLFRRAGVNVVQTFSGLVGFKKLPNFPNEIFV